MSTNKMVNISTHIPADVVAELEHVVDEYRAAGLRINKWEIISEGIIHSVAERRKRLRSYKEVI